MGSGRGCKGGGGVRGGVGQGPPVWGVREGQVPAWVPRRRGLAGGRWPHRGRVRVMRQVADAVFAVGMWVGVAH